MHGAPYPAYSSNTLTPPPPRPPTGPHALQAPQLRRDVAGHRPSGDAHRARGGYPLPEHNALPAGAPPRPTTPESSGVHFARRRAACRTEFSVARSVDEFPPPPPQLTPGCRRRLCVCVSSAGCKRCERAHGEGRQPSPPRRRPRAGRGASRRSPLFALPPSLHLFRPPSARSSSPPPPRYISTSTPILPPPLPQTLRGALARGAGVVVATPARLLEELFAFSDGRWQEHRYPAAVHCVRSVVMDEADMLLQGGFEARKTKRRREAGRKPLSFPAQGAAACCSCGCGLRGKLRTSDRAHTF